MTKMYVRSPCQLNGMMKSSIKPRMKTRYNIIIRIPKKAVPTSTGMSTLAKLQLEI